MRYIDSGNRTAEEALGSWFENQFTPEVSELRWQSGFFSVDGLSPLVDTLQRLASADLPVRALVGSNDGETLTSHVAHLVSILGLPRDGAKLGIVSYAGSFYHPKTYHLRRNDGTQAAYVGSANLTSAGIEALNVEAGLLLDTREGDPMDVLDQIAASVDAWFDGTRTGIETVNEASDLATLEKSGILAAAPPPRGSSSTSGQAGQRGASRPRLRPLVQFPSLGVPSPGAPGTGEAAAETDAAEAAPAAAASGVTTPSFVGTDVVLIAEIGAGGRWTQANYPIAIIRNFFEVEPGTHQPISLYHVAGDGTVGTEERPPIVAVPSQNYRFELGSVRGLPYPGSGRPIGVFLRTATHEFKYVVLMPDNPTHEHISPRLAVMYSGHAHHLKRVIIDAETLRGIWPDCPFWPQ